MSGPAVEDGVAVLSNPSSSKGTVGNPPFILKRSPNITHYSCGWMRLHTSRDLSVMPYRWGYRERSTWQESKST